MNDSFMNFLISLVIRIDQLEAEIKELKQSK